MAQYVNMPKEGITVESCLVGAWRKEIGDTVGVDDVLFEYETDKAAFECLSTASGVLLYKFYTEGDEAPVLTPVAIVGEEGEDISAMTAAGGAEESAEDVPEEDAEDAAEEEPEEAAEEEPEEAAEEPEAAEGKIEETGGEEESAPIKISPRARAYAASEGVDPSTVVPTGPGGRIIEADVIAAAAEAYAAQPEEPETAVSAVEEAIPQAAEAAIPQEAETEMPPAAAKEAIPQEAAVSADTDADYIDEQYSKIRAVIGKTMLASLQRSAQLTNHHSFDASNVLKMREDFKTIDDYAGVSVGDIILYVTSRALALHPEINALVAETGVRKYFTVNLGFAVDTPRGLMVPTIFGAEKKTLREISRDVKALANAAKEGRISPDQLTGGTFTVSNLGATGVEVFTPIINPPQAAIAGISSIIERVRKDKNGNVEVYPSIGISLTYDHRAVDGAPASRFAAELCAALADFSWKTLALEFENEKHS